MRVYQFYLDSEEVGLDLGQFDLDQPPLRLYDGQGQRIEDDDDDALEGWTWTA